MTTTNLDISTSRVSIERIEFSRRLTAMVAMSPSKQALRDELAADVANYRGKVTVIETPQPKLYPCSTRKQEPDIAARMAKRAKERLKLEKEIYMQREVMEMFDCYIDRKGYEKFDRLIADGTIPQPDIVRSVGGGKFTRRWKRERIDQALKLRRLVERHA